MTATQIQPGPLLTSVPLADYLVDYQAISHSEDGIQHSIERLLQTVEAHIAGEDESFPDYQRVVDDSGDPVVGLVIQIIQADEHKHHTLLERIAASLRDGLYWSHSHDALPTTSQPTAQAAGAPIDTVKRLITEEQSGVRLLRKIAQEERTLNGGLISTLLEAMATDSQKHADLLKFVQKRLESREG